MSGDMATFISTLTTGVTADAMWSSIAPAAPLMIFSILFAFAYYVFRKLSKGTSKGKFRV